MKICVATGTRAEYGLLKPLMDEIKLDDSLQLQVLVTGAHLSHEFGLTYQQIEQDNIHIDVKVEMLLSSDSAQGIVKSMGLGMIGFADALKTLKPDLLIILGDRYEMLSLASTAIIFKIPIAHLHGGEITEGAYDDAIRHAITKLSHLHFTSTETYRNRVIQLGENPESVHNVGALGLDNATKLKLLTREELEENLEVRFMKHNFMIAFHPETLGSSTPAEQFGVLLDALRTQKDSFFIFTKSNADTDGRIINQMIDEFVKENPDTSAVFYSLGVLRFLSVIKHCDAMIGNSSSGIIEVPSLHTATINIGDRQKGRIQAANTINVPVNKNKIVAAIEQSKDKRLKQMIARDGNPYGDGKTAKKILSIIKKIDLKRSQIKTFYDL